MPVKIRQKRAQVREASGQRRTFKCVVSTTRVDGKGRITLPAQLRSLLHVEPGTMFAIRSEQGGFFLAKMENPFDALAAEAVAEHKAGRTRPLREFAREHGIAVDGE
jgi:AbrB family looped-hinge helix DNA binding protein